MKKQNKKEKHMRGKYAWRKGIIGEYIALIFLMAKGYIPIKRRYKSPVGEIDIIARRGKHIVFVEVKTRPSHEDAMEALSYRQKNRLRRCAQYWKTKCKNKNIKTYRFDLISISNKYMPKHIQNILD